MVVKKTATRKPKTICAECPHKTRIPLHPRGQKEWCSKYNVATSFVPKNDNFGKKLTSWKQC